MESLGLGTGESELLRGTASFGTSWQVIVRGCPLITGFWWQDGLQGTLSLTVSRWRHFLWKGVEVSLWLVAVSGGVSFSSQGPKTCFRASFPRAMM